MKRKLLILTLSAALILIAAGCENVIAPDGKSNSELATEIAEISMAIDGTVAAGWTATPLPTDTPVPTEIPVENSIFLEPTAVEEIVRPTEAATNTPIPVETRISGHFETRTPMPGNPTPDGRPLAKDWRDWPVLPVVSDNASDIYWYGVQELGTDPHFISVIGDCHSEPNVFLGLYDTDYYDLSPQNEYITPAIDYFRGSFSVESYAVHSGMSAASVLTSTWADQSICLPGENALECEIRIHNPSVMFVNLGSNWIKGVEMDVYYEYLAEIVQTLLDHGILPILSSKADNAEGKHEINQTTAQVARDFDVPFFNFWPIANDLPNHGLDPDLDGIHLSVEAWNWRNFYALKTLYIIGQKLGWF